MLQILLPPVTFLLPAPMEVLPLYPTLLWPTSRNGDGRGWSESLVQSFSESLVQSFIRKFAKKFSAKFAVKFE